MMKTMTKTLPGQPVKGSTSPTSTTSSSSGVSSAASNLSSSLASSKSCERIHNVGHHRNHQPRRRDKSLDSHVKYRTDSKSTKGKSSLSSPCQRSFISHIVPIRFFLEAFTTARVTIETDLGHLNYYQ